MLRKMNRKNYPDFLNEKFSDKERVTGWYKRADSSWYGKWITLMVDNGRIWFNSNKRMSMKAYRILLHNKYVKEIIIK